ncbi:MAG: hypothetical protein BGN84_10845 [Afipia sp. 62-7]|nr:DUF2019 domain-containing protein [Afipia sp.]OJU14922.1 MAG: hypothetical protein BGN84_10845 [Afipia sp. 62-7]
MKKVDLSKMSDGDLVQLFAENTREQDKALLVGQSAKYNRLFVRMKEIHDELKARPGDQRRLLVQLFKFPNMHVRLQAAKLTLAVAPLEARNQLQAIVDSKWFPQAGDAGMCLHNLDTGFYKPT